LHFSKFLSWVIKVECVADIWDSLWSWMW
jgi:hypothetical protein